MKEEDLSLRHRKAFELCSTVNAVILNYGADPQETHLATAKAEAKKLAGYEIQTPQNGVDIRTFFTASMGEVVRASQRDAKRRVPTQLGKKALTALKKVTLPADPVICRMELAFEHCADAAKRFYEAYLATERLFPRATLRTLEAIRMNEAFPGHPTAFHGGVAFKDTEDEKKSVITLRVLPTELECSCFELLPYILMHELVCHWPQMAARGGVRSNPQPMDDPHDIDAMLTEVDPFSEGWMDWLVANVLTWRNEDGRPSAAWDEERRMAETIHITRTKSTPATRFADAPRIAAGHRAAKYVYGLYERDFRNKSDVDKMLTVERDFFRLSCTLNVADWSYRQRFTGCQDIVAACQACEEAGWLVDGLKGKYSAVVRSLLNFRTTFNVDPVLEALTDLKYADLTLAASQAPPPVRRGRSRVRSPERDGRLKRHG